MLIFTKTQKPQKYYLKLREKNAKLNYLIRIGALFAVLKNLYVRIYEHFDLKWVDLTAVTNLQIYLYYDEYQDWEKMFYFTFGTALRKISLY